MQRVVNVVEKDVFNDASQKPIVVAAVTPTDILPSCSKVTGEFAGRYIQNVGANSCYYSFDRDCNDVVYNGILAATQQLDCSNHSCRVSVYSILGTTIAPTILIRADNIQQLTAGIGNFNMP